MAQGFIGEIRMFGGTYAPQNWMFCQGQALPIAQYDAMFALLGTTYGGDGQNTFNLPDLRGRAPVHIGTGPGLSTYVQGQMAGSTSVTLNAAQMPAHSHSAMVSTNTGNVTAPSAAVVPATPVDTLAFPTFYVVPGTSTVTPTAMAATSITNQGGGQPHANVMPYVGMNFIICAFGVFPQRN
ncbi:MAG: phage tail protein [Sphingomonadales bacterium]|nr:phage tail protein [Sphingomonadales bacterium]